MTGIRGNMQLQFDVAV